MKKVKDNNKDYSVTVRLSKIQAEELQKQSNNELLSLSAIVRRRLFYNKATA